MPLMNSDMKLNCEIQVHEVPRYMYLSTPDGTFSFWITMYPCRSVRYLIGRLSAAAHEAQELGTLGFRIVILDISTLCMNMIPAYITQKFKLGYPSCKSVDLLDFTKC